jgi:hypothetical protein
MKRKIDQKGYKFESKRQPSNGSEFESKGESIK